MEGSFLTLTIGEDSGTAFVGGEGTDTFNAFVVQDNIAGTVNTLESFDVLDGGAGIDTLNATIESAAPAPVLKNIENVNLRFTANKGADLTSATGITTLTMQNGTAASGPITGVGSIAAIAVKNQLFGVDLDKSTATTLALTLDAAGNPDVNNATQIVVDLGKTVASKATTLNVTANNSNVEVTDSTAVEIITTLSVAATGANTLMMTEAAKATAVTVSGTGSVDLTGAAFTGKLATFDSSTNTGGVEVVIESTVISAITTGDGDDTITNAVVVAGSSIVAGNGADTILVADQLAAFTKGIDGGAGTDIINIADGATLDATTAKYITNIETLDVSGGTGNYDVSLNSFATVQIDQAIAGALVGDVDFKNAADTFTLTVASEAKTNGDFDVVKNTTVTGKDYAGTTAKGTAETFTLVATLNDGNKDNASDGNIDAKQVTVAGVENLVVNATTATLDGGTDALAAAKHTLTVDFVAAAAETITITGDASVDLSGLTTIGAVTKVVATASTGNVTIDLSGHAKSVAYFGSEGVDAYKASTVGDNLYTGKGADVVTLTAGARDTFVLKASTDSQLADNDKSGKITIAGDEVKGGAQKLDTITTFEVGGGATDDRLDVTNFNFAGAQRGVVDVSAIVTNATNLTSIADLFDAPAGDRGIAYSVIGADSYVLVDANKDGNFTAADDVIIKLVAVATLSETDINF